MIMVGLLVIFHPCTIDMLVLKDLIHSPVDFSDNAGFSAVEHPLKQISKQGILMPYMRLDRILHNFSVSCPRIF